MVLQNNNNNKRNDNNRITMMIMLMIFQVGYCQGSAFIVGLLLMQVAINLQHKPINYLFIKNKNSYSLFSDAGRGIICSAGSDNGRLQVFIFSLR